MAGKGLILAIDVGKPKGTPTSKSEPEEKESEDLAGEYAGLVYDSLVGKDKEAFTKAITKLMRCGKEEA